MPILNIREMGAVGVVSDIAPWDLPPPAFSDGMNFRLLSGKVKSTGGREILSANAGRDIGHITQSTDLKGNSSWVVCGQDAVLLFDGYSFYLLSGAGSFNVDANKWTSAGIGNVTFLNNPEDHPIYWTDDSGTSPSDLEYLPWHIGQTTQTWADVGMSCNIIRSHKNFLFALGMNTPDGQFNDMLHWSHPAEPNGIPFSWRPTIQQPDSIAGSVSLGRGGAIVGGESLRDSFVVYSEEALNVMDFTGDFFGWNRRAVSETAGLVNPHAIVEVKGSHMFFTGDDVVLFDGNTMRSLMHNRLRKRLASTVNNDRAKASWAAHYRSMGEVWFGVPEDGATYASHAYCYNYRDDTWSIRDLESQIIHAGSGREPKSSALTWDKAATLWKEETGSWAQSGARPFRDVMLGITAQRIGDLDPSVSTVDGGSLDEINFTWDGGPPIRSRSGAMFGWDEISKNWNDPSLVDSWDEGVSGTPEAPYGVVAEAKDGAANVRWSRPMSDGGSPIAGYIVTSTPRGIQVQTDQVFTEVTGLDNGTEYTFTVVARNKNGMSNPSSPSNPVTPMATIINPTPPGEARPWDGMNLSWDQANIGAAYKRAETRLMRTDLPIGGHESSTTITRVYPHVDGTATLQFRFGSQQHAGGPVSWVGGFRDFNPKKDRKIDVRTTGELHAYEVRSKGGSFELTGMDIEFAEAGVR